MDEDAGVGKAVAFAFGSAGEEDGGHGSGLADAVGNDVGLDEIHGVEDGEAGNDGAAGGIDVEGDVLFRTVGALAPPTSAEIPAKRLGIDGPAHWLSQAGIRSPIVYKSAMIASRWTPLCRATARRIEWNVPRRSGWWSGIAIL